jgi:hypothetical protein
LDLPALTYFNRVPERVASSGSSLEKLASRAVGIFGRGRKPEHRANVVYVFTKNGDAPPYYSAVCKCGWSVEPVYGTYPDPVIEQQMASAACEHDPAADTSVAFPLDKLPRA